jgi:hypothetical protein
MIGVKGIRGVVAGLMIVTCCVAVSLTFAGSNEDRRVFAIGDVHGSLEGLVEILTVAGLVDAELRWSGGDAILVQTGDLFDRGAHVRAVMDLLMRLQKEAPADGGLVVVLLGNHETMNLLAITRDVNPETYAEFVASDSEKRRRRAYKQFTRHWTRRFRLSGQSPPVFGSEVKEKWMEANPPGRLEYLDAIAKNGVYGQWLRTLPVMYRHEDTLFVHGGAGPALAGMTLEQVNSRVAGELSRFDAVRALMVEEGMVLPWASVNDMAQAVGELRQNASEGRQPDRYDPRLTALEGWQNWFLVSPDGPFWFRGAARWDEAEHHATISGLLESFEVSRMVVGHTPQRNGRIQLRFGGSVVLIDTGMLASVYEGGRPAALEIRGDELTAVYPDGRQPVTEMAEDAAPDPGEPCAGDVS